MSDSITLSTRRPNVESTLNQWLDYWQTIHATAIDMGLERVRPVAAQLDVLHPNVPVITVAGTNGKGSTTTVIASIYQAAGLKTGLYQSPHIQYFNERVRVNGTPVDDQLLIQAFVEVEMARQACGLTLSFFEATTLAAFLIFKQQHCDVWVLEVGLGGRLDVVNLIDPDVAVITNIGVDHVEWLGDNREAIGFEKAGILREGIPLVFGEHDMPESVRTRATMLSCSVYQVGRDFQWCSAEGLNDDLHEDDNFVSEHVTLLKEPYFYADSAETISLPVANLAMHNVSVAIAAVLLSDIKVSHHAIKQGIEEAKLAGRFELQTYQGRQLIADVAHNPHGVNFLLKQLTVYCKKHVTRHIHAIFSMLADKDIATVVEMAQGKIHHWHVAVLDVPRAASMEQLRAALVHVPVTFYPSIAAALEGASAAVSDDDLMLAWGSFHTLEEVYAHQHRDKI